MAENNNNSLYIVERTFFDAKKGVEPSYKIALPATFTDLKSAKAFARNVLQNEGYDIEFLPKYEVNDNNPNWTHGDGVIVYAEGPEGEIFKVAINTITNTQGLKSDEKAGRVPKPLFHVVQTLIDYNDDRSGSKRTSMVEATFATEKAARERALTVLLDEDVTKGDFVEYDEYGNGCESLFGPDIVVHAVKEGGQNVLVSVIAE